MTQKEFLEECHKRIRQIAPEATGGPWLRLMDFLEWAMQPQTLEVEAEIAHEVPGVLKADAVGLVNRLHPSVPRTNLHRLPVVGHG